MVADALVSERLGLYNQPGIMIMEWTDEQSEAIYSHANRLMIRAFAGTGKTETAIGYTQARPRSRFLYIVYTKSAQMEAAKRMPKNVHAVTIHGLAYRLTGKNFRHKLSGNLSIGDIREGIRDSEEMNYPALMLVRNTLEAFFNSPEHEISIDHAHKAMSSAASADPYLTAELAREIWAKMCDRSNNRVAMTHNGYLKLFQLLNIDLRQWYNHILVDEAQDLNPITTRIVDSQRLPLVLIGDPHQSIFRFRGAHNSMDKIQSDEVIDLTWSFRYGPRPAILASTMLMNYKGEKEPLIGCGPETQINTEPSAYPAVTRIHRTFAETFRSAFTALRTGRSIAWNGGVSAYPLSQITDLHWLKQGQKGRVQDPRLIRDFGDYQRYKKTAQELEDPEMSRLVKIVEEFGADVPEMVQRMQSETIDAGHADIVLTTAHRAKGLQWRHVELAADYPDWGSGQWEPADRDDEINLAYVAITRATHALTLTEQQYQLMISQPPALSLAGTTAKTA